MSQYRHGAYSREKQTSLVTPVLAESAMPVVVGVAPVHTLELGRPVPVNEPKLCYSLPEFENYFGKPGPGDNPEDFRLWQMAYVYFQMYKAAPLVAINVFDPKRHTSEKPVGPGFSSTSPDGEIGEGEVEFPEEYPDPSKVTAGDIIGETSPAGVRTGLALVEEVFPRTRLTPGVIMAPGFSKIPAVAKAIETSCVSINGVFRASGIIEIPDEVEIYSDAPAWLNDNNLCDKEGNTIAFFGDCLYNGKIQPGSAHLAGCMGRRDYDNGGVPYWSPSNSQLECEGMVHAGKELFLTLAEANYLNGNGIVTGLNWIGGLRCWGNRTTAYPGVTDVKDSMIPVRRMFSWVSNTVILTNMQHVDAPIRRRQIETVQDSIDFWLNGLVSQDYILGGRCTFEGADNPTLDLMDGIVRWHIYLTPPSPARELEFTLEYDPAYLDTLFVSTGA
ncbi:MAG: phage tail sheath protein [Desulfovibrio sp.]|nr:phage tail sheath protein [Desulfovibrio sp.]